MTRALPSPETVAVSRVRSDSGESRRDWTKRCLQGALTLAICADIALLFRRGKKEVVIPLLQGRESIEAEAKIWAHDHASDIFSETRIRQFLSLKSSTRMGTWRKPWTEGKIRKCAEGLISEKQTELLARAMTSLSQEIGDHEELSVEGARNRMRSLMDDQLEGYCSEILK